MLPLLSLCACMLPSYSPSLSLVGPTTIPLLKGDCQQQKTTFMLTTPVKYAIKYLSICTKRCLICSIVLMDKRFFKRFLRQLRTVSPWLFLGVAVISGVVCIMALRNNNMTALKLRDQVSKADQDNGDVETALRNLRQYIYGHMNTDLASGPTAIKPPIQLKYRYEQLLATEKSRVNSANTKTYNEAQIECERLFPKGLSGSGRIPCVTDYVSKRGIQEQPIPDSLYKFDFVSPLWSPDLAGWSLVVTSVSLALFVIRFGLEKWVKAELQDI